MKPNDIPFVGRHESGGATVLFLWLILCAGAPAQEQENPDAPKLAFDPVAAASTPLPDPTPEPVVLPPAEVLDCVEYLVPGEGRSIIVQKLAPSPGYVAPPADEPASPQPGPPSEEFQARARAAAANRPEMRYLRFSATVCPSGTPESGGAGHLGPLDPRRPCLPSLVVHRLEPLSGAWWVPIG